MLKEELMQFTGTENHYQHLGVVYTDGLRYLAEKAGAYWLLDAIASYQRRLAEHPFQIWRLEAFDTHWMLTAREDSNTPALISQKIEMSDFPKELAPFECYCIDKVVLLKSEY
jgi:hypothetical protein